MGHLAAKHQLLSRRVSSLPNELNAWLGWATSGNGILEKNFSQINVLDYFMRALCKLNENHLHTLDPTADAGVFLRRAQELTDNVVKTHVIWDFFRCRLELRFVPLFRDLLLIADLMSYDCYHTIMDRAKALQIIPRQGFREYPLIGLATEISPATWPRGWRPWALQNHNLPVPVIDLPWDHLANPWELLAVAHEVGHDVDDDLGKLSKVLQPAIANRLEELKVPAERITQWQRWTSEILADLVGILLTGPAFTEVLAEFLTLPEREVRYISPTDEHPPHYLRLLINTALVQRLGLLEVAADIEAGWKTLYGIPGDDFSPYLADAEPVVSVILDLPLTPLQDQNGQQHCLSELIAFTPGDQERIQKAATKLSLATSPDHLSIRHVISASQVAFRQMTETNNAARLEELAQQTIKAITNLSPAGKLIGAGSRRARQHLDELALATLKYPLDDFGIPSTVI